MIGRISADSDRNDTVVIDVLILILKDCIHQILGKQHRAAICKAFDSINLLYLNVVVNTVLLLSRILLDEILGTALVGSIID